MGLDKNFLSELYREMSDGELLSIVSNEYNELTEDARVILTEELTRRGLGAGLEKTIEVQVSELSIDSLSEYIEIITNNPCPLCLSSENKLNAVLSLNDRYTEYIIGCPNCLDRVMGSATGESMGLGLLGGIGGITKTIKNIALYRNIMNQVQANTPSDALVSFIKKELVKSN